MSSQVETTGATWGVDLTQSEFETVTLPRAKVDSDTTAKEGPQRMTKEAPCSSSTADSRSESSRGGAEQGGAKRITWKDRLKAKMHAKRRGTP